MNNLSFTEKLKSQNIEFTSAEPMCEHTTFRIGGPADFFVTVNTVFELKTVIGLCRDFEIPYMVIGNGSNLLVSDEGLKMAIIKLSGDFKSLEISGEALKCGAAVTLSKLCTDAQKNSLKGLEFAYGIPGTVGGAVYMNAGAYGGEIKDVLISVTHLTEQGEVETVPAESLNLAYRYSSYKENKNTILFAEFKLSAGDRDEIKANMDDFMNRRITKQPLEYPSAGSVFKRPEGAFAGALIEQCGFKGRSVGGAEVSEKHSGFIVNKGCATCKDVLNLVKEIQETVKKETGYFLEREIILL
ncbi:MAG: UDP-N-acetylmuramate dehydrogenase [Eubacteriales bacterium]|nr:UDP-N-acetylmuramate dehydrogenase [Eubacteriales bacterium]